MPQIYPFRAVHFDWRRVPLSREVCPPYDVISREMESRLRRMPHNTIHVELPRGGPETRYRKAQETWIGWNREGVLVKDDSPSLYVLQQRFKLFGKTYRRTGVFGALSLEPKDLARVLPHEKTLAKPKEDRLNLLRALKVNTSPIFAVYPDSQGAVRGRLAGIMRRRPTASGRSLDGVHLAAWRVADRAAVRFLVSAFKPRVMMIADGHHRLETAKEYYRAAKKWDGPGAGAGSILCYFCAEEDPGLVVLPTHRVLANADGVLDSARRRCRMEPASSLSALERRLSGHASAFAFGIITADRAMGKQRFALAVPSGADAGRGVPTGLGVEWLAKKLFSRVDPHLIRYTHDSREAARWAGGGAAAFLVKPIAVKNIREAAARIGLLPQKSTYFYPKVQAGIIFKDA